MLISIKQIEELTNAMDTINVPILLTINKYQIKESKDHLLNLGSGMAWDIIYSSTLDKCIFLRCESVAVVRDGTTPTNIAKRIYNEVDLFEEFNMLDNIKPNHIQIAIYHLNKKYHTNKKYRCRVNKEKTGYIFKRYK